jgi:hypothetical protein
LTGPAAATTAVPESTMTTIPSRACAPLISAIPATTTAAAISQAREIPAAIAPVQTAAIILDLRPALRPMEARPVPTVAPAAATTIITAADRQSYSEFASLNMCEKAAMFVTRISPRNLDRSKLNQFSSVLIIRRLRLLITISISGFDRMGALLKAHT